MSNGYIAFFPTREKTDDSIPSDELFVMKISYTDFNRQIVEKSKETTTLAGGYRKIVYSTTNNISVELMQGEYYNESDVKLDDKHMTMFFQSVRSSEIFYLTDIDDGDNLIQVQLSSPPSKKREAMVDVAKFKYSFSAYEVIS